jgi:hypothetical protein
MSNGSDRATGADDADRRTDGGDRGDPVSGDGGGRGQDDRSQRERRGKADRRRLGKRHARARR